MANFLRMLVGLALLPACWGVSRAFFDALLAAAGATGGLSVEALSLLGGIAAFALAWMALSHPVRAYVLGHELTHALCGLCFGAIPTNLKVGLRGGSVMLTKSNVWITLSPYFFPFWTAVVGLLALIVRCFVSPLPFTGAWLFVVGFTLGLHVCFTLRAILQEQPDLEEYGYVFSYVFIWVLNVAGAIAWIVCTSEVRWSAVWARLLLRSANAYQAVGRAFVWTYESVRALPFLQG
jgi:hypothetical protein